MTSLTTPLALLPGTVVASYRILGSIGLGGMAEVFEAEHQVLPRKVALKVMHSSLLRLEDMDRRFLREACVLEAFCHPGGVRVFECGVLEDGRPWMAMELVHGQPLTQAMSEPMSAQQLLPLLIAVADVLAAAHGDGFIHRDLKPDNILLTPEDPQYPLRVIDWGLAHQLCQPRLTQDGSAAGTPAYMSPEQAQGKQLDGSCDIYSLGVIAYEALSGTLPFEGDNLIEIVVKHVTQQPPRLGDGFPQVSAPLSDLVSRMMAKAPAHRPCAADLAAELRRLLAAQTAESYYDSLELATARVASIEEAFADQAFGDDVTDDFGQAQSWEVDIELGELGSAPAASPRGARIRWTPEPMVIDSVASDEVAGEILLLQPTQRKPRQPRRPLVAVMAD